MLKSIKMIGIGAVLIEWDQIISDSILDEIAALNDCIRKAELSGIIDTVPAYASLAVFFQSELYSFNEFVKLILDMEITIQNIKLNETIEIRVRYALSQDNDMSYLMKFSGLSRDEIVRIHSCTEYRVCFIGFLPGFLYLSGLDYRLSIPRKSVPDLKIKSGSVAIGGQQTGIYPQDSPGGWYVIGHTDYRLFDFYIEPYCKLKAGDRVIFKGISS